MYPGSITSIPTESCGTGRGSDRRPLVFIVDDEVEVADLIAMYLTRRGYRTRVFRDPVVAYARLTFGTERPTLLITDYAMREIDGLELVRKFLQLCPGLKTMCVSGFLSGNILLEAKLKPDAVLSKPFTRDILVREVEALLGPPGSAT